MNTFVKMKEANRQIRRFFQVGNQIVFEDLDGSMETVATIIEDAKASRSSSGGNGLVTLTQVVKQPKVTPQPQGEVKMKGRPGRKPGSKNKPKVAEQPTTQKETVMLPEGPEEVETPAPPQATSETPAPQATDEQQQGEKQAA